MAKKSLLKRNLHKRRALYQDVERNSPNYFGITFMPERFTGGKNLFKLRGHPRNLVRGSEVEIEILDFNGEPVYYEVVPYLSDDKSRIIAVYVYDDTASGIATITILGTPQYLSDGTKIKEPVPNSLRYQHKIAISPEARNASEIIYLKEPIITVSEKKLPYRETKLASGFEQTLTALNLTYQTANGRSVITAPSATFTNEHVGGTIAFASPNNPQPDASSTVDADTVPYTASILQVLNDKQILVTPPYRVGLQNSISYHQYRTFDATNGDIEYITEGTYNDTENINSFAYFRLHNIEPETGDLNRIKVFVKRNGTPSSKYELIADHLLEVEELFVDGTKSDPFFPIGTILNTTHLQTYYTASSTNTTIAYPLNFSTGSTNEDLYRAVHIQYATAQPANTYERFEPYATESFYAASEYAITFDAYATRVSNNGSDMWLDVYFSGSAFDGSGSSATLGRYVDSLRYTSEATKRIEGATFTVKPDRDGNGKYIFVIRSGEWKLANIAVTANKETQFTPNNTSILAPIPTIHKNDYLDFRLEFYNYEGQNANKVVEIPRQLFEGGNTYVGGDDNLMSGSLFVSSKTGSGLEMSGENGGMFRSIGYTGYNAATTGAGLAGLLIWSGSILSGSADTYNGVGLELHGGSTSNHRMRFRTDQGIFEVITDTFFLGSGSQFISGANGNIEIRANTAVISGSAVEINTPTFFLGSGAQYLSGSNGNLEIRAQDAILSGSSVSIFAPTFYFGDANQYISGSGGSLEISSSNFYLQPDGTLIIGAGATILGTVSANAIAVPASGPPFLAEIRSDGYAYFETASVAGWDVSPTAFSSSNNVIMDSNLSKIAIAGVGTNAQDVTLTSAGIFLSGSGEFNFGLDSNNYVRNVAGTLNIRTQQLYASSSNVRIETSEFFFGNSTTYISGSGTGFRLQAENARISGSSIEVATDTFFLGGVEQYISGGNGTIELRAQNAILSGSQVSIFTPTFFLGGPTQYISGSGDTLEIRSQNTILSGSAVSVFTPTFFLGSGAQYISGSNGNLEIRSQNAILSGSSVSVFAPTFYFGSSAQYISGSSGLLEISSSNFWLKNNGDVVIGANAVIEGALSASNIAVPAGGPFKAEIRSDGYARFASGSIGGFNIDDTQIWAGILPYDCAEPTASHLVIKSNGEISASRFFFCSGTLGGADVSTQSIQANAGQYVLNTLTGQIVMLDPTNTVWGVHYGDGSNLSFPGTGIVSQSSGSVSWGDVENKPSGLVSGSDYQSGSLSGSMFNGASGTIDSINLVRQVYAQSGVIQESWGAPTVDLFSTTFFKLPSDAGIFIPFTAQLIPTGSPSGSSTASLAFYIDQRNDISIPNDYTQMHSFALTLYEGNTVEDGAGVILRFSDGTALPDYNTYRIRATLTWTTGAAPIYFQMEETVILVGGKLGFETLANYKSI